MTAGQDKPDAALRDIGVGPRATLFSGDHRGIAATNICETEPLTRHRIHWQLNPGCNKFVLRGSGTLPLTEVNYD